LFTQSLSGSSHFLLKGFKGSLRLAALKTEGRFGSLAGLTLLLKGLLF